MNYLTGEIIPARIITNDKNNAVQRINQYTLVDSATPTTIPSMAISSVRKGTYNLTYNSEFRITECSSLTGSVNSELTTLYNALVALTPTVTNHAADHGNGETLTAGVYTQSAAMTVTGTLTLDGEGDANALFVFRCAGAFATAAASTIVLTNGATSNNVWFVSEGAGSTGASSTMRGSLLANQAAVSTGAATAIEGRMFARNGAAATDASIFTAPTGTSVQTIGNALVNFSIFTGSGAVSNTGASNIAQNIGTNNGNVTGYGSSTLSGITYPSNATAVGKVHVGIYIDGVLVENSMRSQTRSLTDIGSEYHIILQDTITTTSTQEVDIRAHTTIGKASIGPNMLLLVEPLHDVIYS